MPLKVIKVLKVDSFGRIELVESERGRMIRRVACGGKIPGSAIAARFLARREQRILGRLTGIAGVPQALGDNGQGEFYRSYIEGAPLYESDFLDGAYFANLLELVDTLHRAGVTHNDLAKEANILVTRDSTPALIDFQIAFTFPARRGPIIQRMFEMLTREDHRHVLKQKQVHRADLLTDDDIVRLARKSMPVRIWSATLMKPWQWFLIRFGLEPASGPHRR
jgi:RIO-like serine/threonine protein kinase